MQAVKRSPDYDSNYARAPHNTGKETCVVCGRNVNPVQARWLHLHEGGLTAVTEEEAEILNPAADMGMYPIGRDCLRSQPALKPYAHK